jgi:methyltransferase-like protein
LLAADLTGLHSLGKFDYIIAHGLYSWVPEVVRERILAICRERLAPQGVAYISYNAYPGCHLREVTRDMMRFHSRDVSDPRQRVAQSRALINWVSGALSSENAYSILLRDIRKGFETRHDGSLYHDDLADINQPFYFHEFAAQAAQHGLQFLSEADYFEAEAYYEYPEEVRAQLGQLGAENILAKEQYLDFLKGRSFRQTLLCHHEVALDRPLKLDGIRELYIKSQAAPVSDAPDIASRAVEEFRTKSEGSIATDLPLAKAAMLHLTRIHPRAIRFDELVTEARELAGPDEASTIADDALTLAEVMMKTYGAGVIDLRLHEPVFVLDAGEFPISSPLARLQAQSGNVVTTLLHATLRIEDNLALQLIRLLDGTRDRAALLRELTAIIESNLANEATAQISAAEKEALLLSLPQQLDDKLAELGTLGLLLA